MELELNPDYFTILQELKEKIRQARLRASISVNTELLKIYFEIGESINEQQEGQKWGSKIIERLIADLRSEFSDMKGLSPRNLRYMRDFAKEYPDFLILQRSVAKLEQTDNESVTILQRTVAKLPWGHNCVLLDRTETTEKRLFYAQKAIENGWSRDVLAHHIQTGLFESTGSLSNNFSLTLPRYDSDLALQIFKDPYQLDFIMLGEEAKEKDLEDALMTNVIKFLLELGDGFSLYARQKRFTVGEHDFKIDLLFYHTKLRRFIVIELKIGEFKAEYVSKMNLYLGIVDDELKDEYKEPSIGLILCKTKDKVVAEYALRDTQKPIGIALYRIGEQLPSNIKGELPTIEEIELKMDQEMKEKPNPTEARLQAIKDKLKKMNKETIQTPATPELLREVLQEGLIQLYQSILMKMEIFKEDFHETGFRWYSQSRNMETVDDLTSFWLESVAVPKSSVHEINFSYRLLGLKQGGTETYNDSIELVFIADTYWYGFRLVNYNNQSPFLKKLYHEKLSENDITAITDIVMNQVIDRMEHFVNRGS